MDKEEIELSEKPYDGGDMKPTLASEPIPTVPNIGAIIQLLNTMSKQLDDLEKKLDDHCNNQSEFMIAYTKSHSELESAIKVVDEKTERAHKRIDSMNKTAWAILTPLLIALIISSFGFLWAILNHTVTITMP